MQKTLYDYEIFAYNNKGYRRRFIYCSEIKNVDRVKRSLHGQKDIHRCLIVNCIDEKGRPACCDIDRIEIDSVKLLGIYGKYK